MQYHAVVERFVTYPPLDPLAMLAFAAVFVCATAIVQRRPGTAAALLAFAAPFSFYASFGHTTITLPKVLLAGAIAGLLSRLRDAMPSFQRVRPILLGFLAIGVAIAFSALHSPDRAAVARELLKWIEYGLFFCTAYASYAIDPRDTLVRRAFFTSIAIVCASALVQEVTGSPSGIDFGAGTAPRIAGVLEGPNQLAGFLEVALAMALAWSSSRSSRSAPWVAFFAGLTLMLTFSRGGMVGTVVALTIVLVVGRGPAKAYSIAPLLAAGALGACIDAAWAYAARRFVWLRTPTPGIDHSGGVGHRSELWSAALSLFRRSPLTGVGAGNFETQLPAAGVYGVRTHANNWYLQSLAEGGVLLCAATLFFLAALITRFYSLAPRSRWALAAFAATAALAVHQTVDYLVFYPKVAEPWIVLCALGSALPGDPCD